MWASRGDNYTWDDEKGAKDFLNARLSLLSKSSRLYSIIIGETYSDFTIYVQYRI